MSIIAIDKEEFEKFYRRSVGDFKKKYLTSDYYKYVVSQTSFLDEIYSDVKLWQRRYHIINNIDHILTCPLCGRPRAVKTDRAGYMKTCDDPTCIGQGRSLSKKKSDKEKYGTDNYFITEEYKQKSRQTCLEKYGVEHIGQAKEVKDKIKKKTNKNREERLTKQKIDKKNYKDVCLERYGVEYYQQSEEFKQKSRQTCLEKYGVEHYAQTDDWKQKSRQTCLEKYGVTNIANSENYKKNIQKIREQAQKTCIERYGTYPFTKSGQFKDNIEKHKDKQKQTCLSRYGVDSYYKSQNFQDKISAIFTQRLINKGYYDKGYRYLMYCGNNKHKLYCPKCDQSFMIDSDDHFYYRNIHKQEICTNCNPIQKSYSVGEKELLDYVSSIYSGTIVENDRSVINPYELDIYLPDLHLAIEYNGLYWHSDEQKPNNYHRMKSDLCKEKGVHLIHVFEDDWVNKQSIIKSVISNFVNNSVNRRIYARKCEVRAISDKTLINNFLVSNHLLGRTTFISYCAGLYYEDELVSLITMHLLKKAERKWELNRYAIKNGVTIIGGAERLLKHIIQTIDYSSIITYNDNSIFRGLVYKRLGFQYVRTNAPNYMFIQGDCLERFPKQTIRKWNVGYSREMEQQLGLHRVYNAGNDVYVLNK